MVNLFNRILSITLLSVVAIAAYSQSPPQANTEREAAIKLYRQGDNKAAIKNLRYLLKKNKTDSEAWYYLGLALTRDGKFKDAGQAYESAITLKPDFASARTGLAFTLLLRNQLKDSLAEGQRALALNPNLPDAHYVVGVVFLRNGELQKALAEADFAIKTDPNYARGHLLRSQALVGLVDENAPDVTDVSKKMLANYREAVSSLERYLQLNHDATDDGWREQLESLKSTVSLLEATGKTIFRSGEVTERARVTAKPEPGYTESARSHGVTGTVVLRAVFGSDGKIKHLSVIRGLPDGLTEQALDAARKIKFVPAKIGGRPASMWMQLEYNFNLY